MNWGEIIFFLLTVAGVFVLIVIVFVLKADNPVDDKKSSKKQDRPESRD